MAPLPATSGLAAALLIAAAATSSVEAFVSPTTPTMRGGSSCVAAGSAATTSSSRNAASSAAAAFVGVRPTPLSSSSRCRIAFALNAAEEGAEAETEDEVAEGDEKSAEAEDEGGAEEEEEEEPAEDPEVTKIKSEIAELEAIIKEKQSSLNQITDAAEGYTESGYMRKVAEMDQIRKTRGEAFKSNKFTARANILQQFLPVLDELTDLDTRFEGNEAAKSYSALRGSFSSALTSLGAAEFTAEVGGVYDVRRHESVREEYSDDIAEGAVLEPVAMGMEIEGNVMRRAQVAVSLGSEAEALKKAEAAKAKAEAEEAAKAEAEAEEAEGEGEEEGSSSE